MAGKLTLVKVSIYNKFTSDHLKVIKLILGRARSTTKEYSLRC